MNKLIQETKPVRKKNIEKNPWTASGILEIVCILLNYNWHKTLQ